MTTARATFRRTMLAAGATTALAALGFSGAAPASAAQGSSASLSAIRECESGGSYKAQNPSSTASGAYQIIDGTWRSLDASGSYARAKDAPKSVQDAAARELIDREGTTPWNASKSCWG